MGRLARALPSSEWGCVRFDGEDDGRQSKGILHITGRHGDMDGRESSVLGDGILQAVCGCGAVAVISVSGEWHQIRREELEPA